MQMLVLQPELARGVALPPIEDGGAEEAALAALVDHVAVSEGPLTTAAVLQWFADTPHDAVLSAALATVQDQGLAPELAEAQLREGVERPACRTIRPRRRHPRRPSGFGSSTWSGGAPLADKSAAMHRTR